jgi:hypothetical protein
MSVDVSGFYRKWPAILKWDQKLSLGTFLGGHDQLWFLNYYYADPKNAEEGMYLVTDDLELEALLAIAESY